MAVERRYVWLLNRAQKRLHRHLEQRAEQQAGISVVQALSLIHI